MRRIMMEIAQRIAKRNGSMGLITGESIGQVASQTMHSLVVTDAVAQMPVFRPLIGFDKEEIVQIAKKIDTFETSILPYEDCCTIFVPKHPQTKPQLERIQISEKALEDVIEEMMQKAIETMEVVEV
jgi:thiamine biosynthesis protein ThiI